MNPLNNGGVPLGKIGQGVNPMQMMKMIQGMKNPQAMLQNALQSNPQMQEMMKQVQSNYQGNSPEQIAKQLAQQNGIDEKMLTQMYNTLAGRH